MSKQYDDWILISIFHEMSTTFLEDIQYLKNNGGEGTSIE